MNVQFAAAVGKTTLPLPALPDTSGTDLPVTWQEPAEVTAIPVVRGAHRSEYLRLRAMVSIFLLVPKRGFVCAVLGDDMPICCRARDFDPLVTAQALAFVLYAQCCLRRSDRVLIKP